MAIKKRLRAKMVRGIRSALKMAGVKMSETIYHTEFVNMTGSEWTVFNGPHPLLTVPAMGKSAIECFLPTIPWTRWRRVIKKSADEYQCEENPAWLNPYVADFYLELFNEDGLTVESIRVADGNPLANGLGFIHAMKGIPQIVPMRSLNDPYIYYKSIHWTKEKQRKQIRKTDYSIFVERVVARREPRSDNEVAEIVRRRAEEARKAAEAKAEDEALRIAAEAANATGADGDEL